MAIPVMDFGKLSPQAVNPLSNLLSGALDTYQKGITASYLPRRLEAEIFSKQISPLATLSTTPMFLQNPQFQAALSDMLSKHLGGISEQMGQANHPGRYETFAERAQKDLGELKSYGKELTEAGKAKTEVSRGAAAAENYFGPLGKNIYEKLTGTTSELSNKQKQFDSLLDSVKNNIVQSGKMTAQQAEKAFTRKKDETPEALLKRVERSNPGLFNKQETMQPQENISEEDQQAQDNADLSFALQLANEIHERTGHDVPENVILNYMDKHPGKINIKNLLKAMGIK